MEVQAPEEVTVSSGYSGNKRKRTVPTSALSSETFAQPCDTKKMKVTPTLLVGDRKHQEEEEEEEVLGNGSESQEKINLYCDSQSLSQSENEEGIHAPPSSPRHESQSQNSQSQSQELHLQVTRSPKKRPLTPQNSSANLNGMMLNRADSQGTKQLLSATRDVLSKRLNPNEKDKKASEDEKLSRTAVGYVHTPLTPDEKLLKPKTQTIQTVLSPEYWRKVCPKLHVQDKDFVIGAFSKFTSTYYEEEKEKRLNDWRDSMSENGYYETGVLDWGFKIKRLASAAATLRKLGWHPVWLVMFDEAWLMASCLSGIFRRTVNTKMDFNADFWAWYLDPMLEEKGWEVHRDRFNMPLAESAEPHYATAWVALTDATPKNGCMYVVPARFDPDYASLRESTDFDVQNLRALPAPAGGALVWSGRTLHFGGRADKGAEVPRISISFAASTPAFEDPKMRFMFGDKKQDLLLTVNREKTIEVNNGESGRGEEGGRRYSFLGKETVSLPSLKTRMGIIATQLWTYQHRIPIPPHVKELLRALENQ